MMSVTPSSSKLPDPRWDYDVYVSFRGEDTIHEFMNHLFAALERNRILTFQEYEPPGGENICAVKLQAIQRSRISMVVLSRGYVCSEYCLDELVEILYRRSTIDHFFFPIFYHLDPSDVQKRIETLEEDFARPEKPFGTSMDQRVQRWIAALTEATNSSDWMLHDDANGSMGILKFVEVVLDVVCTRLNIPRNTLRMDSFVEMMTDFLYLGTSDIYIVGMSCVDEILKETLIEAVFSQIHHGFERRSLILNITEISKVPNGLVDLQEQLLCDILGMNKVNIKNADEGISLIEEALQGKRVLIVLDNVDELKQLHTLIGNSKCFGPGSRVIAISRDKQLRIELEAHGKYEVEDLHDWKSPQLFIWRAFMMDHPAEYFSDEKWIDHFLQLKYYEAKFNPDDNLDLSGEGSEKQINLELEEVVFDTEALEMTLHFSSFDALQTLNLSRTHISSLPKSIVRLISLKRLILSDCPHFMELPPEVGQLKQLQVLDLTGTRIKHLDPSFFNYMHALQTLNLSNTGISTLPESIVRLVGLKRLILRGSSFFKKLPPEVGELKQLEVLDLEGSGITDLPPSFFDHMHALQTLYLSKTCISSLPKSIVGLVSLKRLILSDCHHLMELPEKLRCPMLLELYLHNNHKLRTIPPSFFHYMPALQILNISKTCIRSLPESIVKLVSLKRLILSYQSLSKVGELKQIEVIDLEGTKIMDLHESVIDLEGKEIIHLPENPNHPKYVAVFLNNNHKLKMIPNSFFDNMPTLKILNLSRTGIRFLPESIFRLVSLKILILSYCHRFLRLSPKVGELKQLEVLDLEGTDIMDLPEEIKELTNLTCLNLSFYGHMGEGSSVTESDAVVPRGVISALYDLKELMISVNPDDKRWNACVEDIVTQVCTLNELNTLVFYFPRVELVSHCLSNRQRSQVSLFKSLSHFRFIVGHHVKRIMSRRPHSVQLELERWAKCLEYINGDKAIPEEIKEVLYYSTAFFLERHATVKNLSDFGIENMIQLKCCVVGECNEVEVIIDETDAHEEDDEVEASSGIVLGSLEYLCIYYMKNLRSIWEGPIQQKCLSLLKFLTLRTCPQLTTIFTKDLLDNLYNLEELTIDDCPSIKTLISCEVSAEHKTSHFLPNLKRIALHFMPGLVSISSGLLIAPRLDLLSFYNCPNLKNLSIKEVYSKDLKIEGEKSWWEALEWSTDHPAYLDDFFVPFNIEDY